eukprot:scaffold731_cov261-Pinguiococcus_pyrenoidosus.AAC.15
MDVDRDPRILNGSFQNLKQHQRALIGRCCASTSKRPTSSTWYSHPKRAQELADETVFPRLRRLRLSSTEWRGSCPLRPFAAREPPWRPALQPLPPHRPWLSTQ